MTSKKPREGAMTQKNDHINLEVVGRGGSVVQFKIKRHTPLSKLMKAYCEQQELEMEDEDTIDVFQQRTEGMY
ncbi:small ubiquitin-related modifier 2-like isoform X2 [Pteronotus mesoamericanus]|uniref:small ubiquitin-related modifier 2-like isoform X2 n=1 Tax=Pteronotus mesoamericanus TaxID=1884717 RepID=UPI0023EC7C64|nr:small ubiquitin-related modifier 2-like isoform X2 [Pteronotus parnellii mesoamericanus]